MQNSRDYPSTILIGQRHLVASPARTAGPLRTLSWPGRSQSAAYNVLHPRSQRIVQQRLP